MEGVTERNMAMCFVSSFLVYENEMVTEQNQEMEFSDFFEGVVRLSSWSLRAHQEREKAEEWAEAHVEGAAVGEVKPEGKAEEKAEGTAEEVAEEKAKGKGEEKGDENVEGTDDDDAEAGGKKKKKTTKQKAEKVAKAGEEGKPEAEEEEEGRHSRNKLDKMVGLLVPQGRRQSSFAKHLELAASSTTKAGKMSVAVLKVRLHQ